VQMASVDNILRKHIYRSIVFKSGGETRQGGLHQGSHPISLLFQLSKRKRTQNNLQVDL